MIGLVGCFSRLAGEYVVGRDVKQGNGAGGAEVGEGSRGGDVQGKEAGGIS